MTGGRLDRHLDHGEVAGYVDGVVSGDALTAIEAHLSVCPECRAEVSDVSSILRTAPSAGHVRRRVWIPAAAAAALVLLWVVPRAVREPAVSAHREEAVTTTVAPRPVAPRGTVDSTAAFVWSSVPYANSYRIRLYDADGSLLWEQETGDTITAAPTSVRLRARTSYFWKVEAQTGFNRWAASDLVEFTPRHGGNQR